jgi:transposase, IS5 family
VGELRFKAQIADNVDGVILDHSVKMGNPADAPQLVPVIQRVARRAERAQPAVTTDRGYGKAAVERDLHELGVRSVAILRKGKPGADCREFEHRNSPPDKIKWRIASKGRINHTKRSYGWNRTQLTGIQGARTWCGHGVFAHNLVKVGALAAENQTPPQNRAHTEPPAHTAITSTRGFSGRRSLTSVLTSSEGIGACTRRDVIATAHMPLELCLEQT